MKFRKLCEMLRRQYNVFFLNLQKIFLLFDFDFETFIDKKFTLKLKKNLSINYQSYFWFKKYIN